ncbi:MAG: branched-chain amino acid aminotransferase [Eubacteriales bacterium]|nr:branched-chain amino acid aminotransferase [Eubacteriales bacterium]
MPIPVTLTQTPKQKPAPGQALPFGRLFTDHMLLMDYSRKQGWHSLRVVPYGDFTLPPSAMVFHYAQEVFEGMKAYAAPGGLTLFRPMENLKRMNASCRRLCIPEMPLDEVYEGLLALLKLEKDWVPADPGTSLYIRPTVIATEAALGVKASDTYLFFVILSPVGAYYASGFNPLKIVVEEAYTRAAPGGTGSVKCGGNYGGSILASYLAHEKGFDQVLWLDAAQRRYVEEVSSMNIFFVINGQLVTPGLGDTILPGITRDAILKLAGVLGIPAQERRVSLEEIVAAQASGALQEAFGAGTAAVVAPIGSLTVDGKALTIGNGATGPITKKLHDTLTGIQRGNQPDPLGWVVKVI